MIEVAAMRPSPPRQVGHATKDERWRRCSLEAGDATCAAAVVALKAIAAGGGGAEAVAFDEVHAEASAGAGDVAGGRPLQATSTFGECGAQRFAMRSKVASPSRASIAVVVAELTERCSSLAASLRPQPGSSPAGGCRSIRRCWLPRRGLR
ncbi:hypothetical protein, partial [uncultured Xanthomonas sp.]|uniref:hypothetical protein n=1 Tax=uncultured Xanthomonas sp. TaxID=152831 RepID=UPI0025FB5EFE